MSNRIRPELHGTVQLCCVHHVEKNKYSQLLYDRATEKPSECICCGNVFAYPFNVKDAPLLCPGCTPIQLGGLYG